MFDFFCCSRGREKEANKNNLVTTKKGAGNAGVGVLEEKEPKFKEQKRRECCGSSELRNTSGLLTAAAGITLIVASGGVAAPIVAGSLTTTAGVIQMVDANLN